MKPRLSDPTFSNIYAAGQDEAFFSDAPFYCDYLRSLLNLFEIPCNSVLDVGCGNAIYGQIMKKTWGQKLTYLGYDIDDDAFKGAPKNLVLRQGSLSEIPLRSKFDVVLCHSVLQYIDDLDAAFARLARLVKQSGIVSIFQTVCREDYDRYKKQSDWSDDYAWIRPRKAYLEAAYKHFDVLSYGVLVPKNCKLTNNPLRVDQLFVFRQETI